MEEYRFLDLLGYELGIATIAPVLSGLLLLLFSFCSDNLLLLADFFI
jgi:hypothetical protein